MIPISIFYQILLFLGDSIFLGIFELGYEVLDITGADTEI